MSVHCLCDLDLWPPPPQFVTDVLSLYDPKFNDYIDVIYPEELEIKDSADAPKRANYLYLHLEFDEDGKLFTQLYDKRDDFDFPIVNFPYLGSNIQDPVHIMFLFHGWYVMLGFVRNMKIFRAEDPFWFQRFQSYWSRDILHGNFRLLFGNSMVVIHTMFTNLTPLYHICWMVCSLTVSSYFCKSWRVPHVGQELLTLSEL